MFRSASIAVTASLGDVDPHAVPRAVTHRPPVQNTVNNSRIEQPKDI
jgi:hypothetical protein